MKEQLMMQPMSKIVRAMTGLLYPLIIVFGAYLIIHGHLTPGGGFQGGAVAASAIALAIVAYGSHYYSKNALSGLESAGLLLFIFLGFLGMTSVFMFNFLANTGGLFGDPVSYGISTGNINTSGTIALMNIAVGCEVVGALGLILVTLARGPPAEVGE
ncbi:MAG: MnhB domain-containing protein [Candidatus Thermoplasmatota archaeon]|nr:MnhB domain-containing protein [Candidatus Thermoplasmatota archaeon]